MKEISNRYKREHTGEWTKNSGPAKSIRTNKSASDEKRTADHTTASENAFTHPAYKNKKICPFCLNKSIVKSHKKGEKFRQQCRYCGAIKLSTTKCPQCNSNNVWKKVDFLKCQHCNTGFYATETG